MRLEALLGVNNLYKINGCVCLTLFHLRKLRHATFGDNCITDAVFSNYLIKRCRAG